jgi:GNAT superfamily N-acetyltransferase
VIRRCNDQDFDEIYAIINDGAQAYKGVIPGDRWAEPYMSCEKLRHEIEAGVEFWGIEDQGALAAVMGLQHVQDVTLIRHAYTRTAAQKRGLGTALLAHLREMTDRPVLIGTWADAAWAIRFYEKHGFRMVSPARKEVLLRRYWSIPERQTETSVVLTDGRRWAQQSDEDRPTP